MNRRGFIQSSLTAGLAAAAAAQSRHIPGTRSIDRARVLRRHNPVFSSFSPFQALSVGNGEFAFTADITGLQTFASQCEADFPLCTAAHWAWHTSPRPPQLQNQSLHLHEYRAHGRLVPYPTQSQGQEALFDYLRENEHKFHLGKVAFELGATGDLPVQVSDLSNLHQQLDLWTGVLESRFTFHGHSVRVLTCAHPVTDTLAVRIESPLMSLDRLRVNIAFPYASPERSMADWTKPDLHATRVLEEAPEAILLERVLDATRYRVAIAHSTDAQLKQCDQHDFAITSNAAPDTYTKWNWDILRTSASAACSQAKRSTSRSCEPVCAVRSKCGDGTQAGDGTFLWQRFAPRVWKNRNWQPRPCC